MCEGGIFDNICEENMEEEKAGTAATGMKNKKADGGNVSSIFSSFYSPCLSMA